MFTEWRGHEGGGGGVEDEMEVEPPSGKGGLGELPQENFEIQDDKRSDSVAL